MKNKISFLLEMLVFGVLVFMLGCSKEPAENIPAPSEDRLTVQEQAMVSDLNDRRKPFRAPTRICRCPICRYLIFWVKQKLLVWAKLPTEPANFFR